MISKKLVDALNDQIQKELYSSHLYLAMSAWCEAANLPGFAHWLRVQFDEERSHALRLFDYMLDRGAKVVVPAVEAPKVNFKTIQDVFHAVVEHEKKITESINKLRALAQSEGDFATALELDWFVKEQVEEEKTASLIAAQLDMVGDKSAAILNLDHQAGKRGS